MKMDDSGAEALDDYEIDAIPKVSIAREHVANALQCSVCLEYFEVNEVANVLPCIHYFHEGCIRPWLERRGTCPQCRLNLVPNQCQNTQEFEADEETLSGYESAHSNMIPSYVSLVSYDELPENRIGATLVAESADGHIYYEDIDDAIDEDMDGMAESLNNESFHNLNDLYSNQIQEVTMFSQRITITPQTPMTSEYTASDDESDRYADAGSKRRWNNDDGSLNDASGSHDNLGDTTADYMNNCTTIDYNRGSPSAPSIITISDASNDDDDDVFCDNNSHDGLSLSDLSDQMSIVSLSSISLVDSSIDTVLSTSDISMNDDHCYC